MSRLWCILLLPLLALAVAYIGLRYVAATIKAPAKALRIADMLDQTANVALNGADNMTISTRAALARQHGRRWGCVLCWVLDHIQADHCATALEDAPCK